MKKFIKLALIALLLFPIVNTNRLNAATASFFTSGAGNFYTGATINVTVFANGDADYNAVTVNVSYSNLTFLGASAAGGWTGISGPSNNGSTVSFSGALLGSSANGSRAVLNLSFRAPYSSTTGSITSSGTIALADGSGTQVNGGGNTAVFNISAPPPPPPPPEPAPSLVSTSSSTHPSQDAWYKEKNITLSWNKENKVDGFSYALDKEASTIPDETSDGVDTTKTFENLGDGIHYFHIRAHNNVGWGETSHFRINIDTTPPDPFGIAKMENETGDKYILYFHTNDSLSGIDHYILTIDGVDKGKQNSKYEVDKNVGTIVVTAFDKAGNSTSEEFVVSVLENIKVEPEPFVFDLNTALITTGVIFGIGLFSSGGIFLYKRIKSRQQNSKKEDKSQVDESNKTLK